ncbi:MAG: hypothetical protein M1132_12265 [Chloroflexi bacterium]|nr:hypothetical protein [Chloroflexota bacterium]
MVSNSSSRLTFFSELGSRELQALVADGAVIEHLCALEASVSLAVLDHSPERAEVVRLLNQAGIPVTAWLLLPKEEGYFFNVDSPAGAVQSYAEFKEWTAQHQLAWAGVGLDIEPDIRDLSGLASGGRSWLLRTLPRRWLDYARVRRAQIAYAALVAQIRADGYGVESYQFPFIADERRAGSTLLQRLFRIVEIPVDREILMLYTSFWAELGPAMLWSYGREAQAIAVGITGPGVESEGIAKVRPLDWEEFARDLSLARRWTTDISVYSLEGCVRQGFLPRLKSLDWTHQIEPPAETVKRMERLRRAAQAILWMDAHPTLVLGALVVLLWLFKRPSFKH